MNNYFLMDLSLVFGLGALMQWLSWRLKLPSILLLLITGLVVGPWLHLVDAYQLFGTAFGPVVSICVALILFEGGLHLKLSELSTGHNVVRNLLTIGALVTWAATAILAHGTLGLTWQLCILLGAILVVTGPTVVMPLLQFLRPKGQVNAILKWEGILIDPIGAILAVLVYEAIMAEEMASVGSAVVFGVIKTFIVGLLIGGVGAAAIYYLFKQRRVPDYLHNSVTLALLVGLFTLSNQIQPESGLLTVTLMGVLLANQQSVSVRHILEFKENLRVLILASLFILLAARVQMADVMLLSWDAFLFVGGMIFLVRPLSVLISTFGSDLNWREKLFLCWMAPRGIVAAAVSSIMALNLEAEGITEARSIVPIVFLVILGTITLYGLTAKPLLKLLKLKEESPQGILIVGANPWSIRIASLLKSLGFRTLMVDNNPDHIRQAMKAEIPCTVENILSDTISEDLSLEGIGHLLAMTASDKVNSLATMRFQKVFGNQRVFQLKPETEDYSSDVYELAGVLTNNPAFIPTVTYSSLHAKSLTEYRLRIFNIAQEIPLQWLSSMTGDRALLMFILTGNGKLQVLSERDEFKLNAGDRVIYMTHRDLMLESMDDGKPSWQTAEGIENIP